MIFFFLFSVSGDSSCTVDGCNTDFCVDTNCTKCNEPYFLSIPLCKHCYLHCRLCDGKKCYRCIHPQCKYACEIADCHSPCTINALCTSCPNGFYRIGGICYSCLHTGCMCSSATNCIDCLSGRYDTSSNCEHTCPSECISCTSANNCSKCVSGKFGPACESNCISNCQDGSCYKESGMCPSGCPANQYLDSKDVCRLCPSRCSSCINSTHCTSCAKTYNWGEKCEYDCVGCYNNCNRSIGCASNCSDYYYRAYNNGTHGYECIRCPNNCLTCTSATECTTCDTNYWGTYCQHNCYGCSSDCSKSLGCDSKCITGYYPEAIDTGSVCKQCSDHCDSCSAYDICHVCQSGYFVGLDKSCVQCSANCTHQSCDKTDGTCIGGCIDGLTGPQCNQKCPVNCVSCRQFNMSICDKCEIDYYGDNCENRCSINCNLSNGQSTCVKSDGSCILGCKNEFWGSKCNHECSVFCANRSDTTRLCNATNGKCHNGCINGRYGEYCKEICSEYCEGRTCFQQNGTCKEGSVGISSTVEGTSTFFFNYQCIKMFV